MPRNYVSDIDADDLRTLGFEIRDDWDADNQDRETWLMDLPKWLKHYQGRVERKDDPWEGASNLHVPVVGTVVDALHPKAMSALWRPNPVVAFRPQEPTDEALVQKREKFLDWAVREEMNLYPVMDRVVLLTFIYGVQFVKTTWDLKIRNLRDKHTFPGDMDPQQVIAAVLKAEGKLIEAVRRIDDTHSLEAVVNGQEVKLEIEVDNGNLYVYTEREEVIRDAPVSSLISPEDISLPADSPWDIQDADHINHRYWLTIDEVKRRVRQGLFDLTDDEVEELDLMSDTGVHSTDNTFEVKAERDTLKGIETVNRTGGTEKLEFIDSYRRYDINDDGYDEEVLITIVREKPSIVARVNRLEDVYRHGMRPFTIYTAFPVDDSIWAMGVPFILDGLQQEVNTIHNQRVDSGEVANTPFGWYVPSAGQNPEPQKIRPGYMFPIDDINSVRMHQPANWTAWRAEEEALLWTIIERRMKVNDLTLGRIGASQGAARTAQGVQALSAQQATGFDIIIRRFQESFRLHLQQIQALYQQYMPPGKQVRILGKLDEEPTLVTREDITGKMDMIFTGNSLSTDREIERQTLTFLLQSMFSPNALGFFMQIGITNPQGIAEWCRHVLDVFDVPKLERIIQIPDLHIPLSPEEIVNHVIEGERLTPKPDEDNQKTVDLIIKLLRSPQAVGLSPEATVLLQEQIMLRQQLLQQQQMMQMIAQAVVQQQAMGQQGPMQPGQAPPQGPQGQPGMPPGAPGPPQPAPVPPFTPPAPFGGAPPTLKPDQPRLAFT